MAEPGPIRVDGLRELQRSLRAIDRAAPRELRLALLEIARGVAKAAAAKVPVVTGRAAASYKPRASTTGASVAFGGRAEYVPWLEFGGRVGRNGSIARDQVKGGRYLYPTLAEKGDEIRDTVDEAMADLARRHDITTRG